jgi:hypothetical protein
MKKPLNNLILAFMLVCQPVLAADKAPEPPKGSTPVPDGAPTASNIEEPSITIRNQGRERIEEYRIKGKLYMLRVTPPKGKPYYLIDQLGRGEFTRQEGPAAPTAVPQWVIHSF